MRHSRESGNPRLNKHMKNYLQFNKGFGLIQIIAIVAVLAIGGVYFTQKGSKSTDVTAPTITLVSPNGGETLTIGSSTTVVFTTTGEIKDTYRVVIWLDEGAAPLATIAATTTSYSLTIPASILIGGDAVAPLQPGSYKIRVALYDGVPCTGHCLPSDVKELASDSSDGVVIIATSTMSGKVLPGGIVKDFKGDVLINSPVSAKPSITVLSPNEAEKLIVASKQVLVALKAKDYQRLQTLTSLDGLSLNESPDSLDLTKNDVPQSEISKIPTNTTIKLWGYTDGKGDPINLTVGNYIDKWIYNKEYLDAPKIEVNKIIKIAGSTSNEIMTYSDGRNFVAFHFDGFNPKYSGLDWTTMYLIFDLQNGEYKLRAIVKDNWTI
jgi:hypothetical protein